MQAGRMQEEFLSNGFSGFQVTLKPLESRSRMGRIRTCVAGVLGAQLLAGGSVADWRWVGGGSAGTTGGGCGRLTSRLHWRAGAGGRGRGLIRFRPRGGPPARWLRGSGATALPWGLEAGAGWGLKLNLTHAEQGWGG
jgi:hypothetical protein